MVPLEVTHTALVTKVGLHSHLCFRPSSLFSLSNVPKDVLAEIQALNTPFSQLLSDLLLFFAQTYREVFGFDDPVCDMRGSSVAFSSLGFLPTLCVWFPAVA